MPSSATVRFDANNLWVDADACVAYFRQLTCHYWAIEEPVGAFDVEALKAIARELNRRVILDESCLREEHAAPFLDSATSFIANIRVSKCGGILRSIELANYCLSNGIDVILGAHVGETSLLTRAAMVVAQGMLKRPLAREGAFGRILLKHDIADTPLQFGRGGVLQVTDYGLRHKHGLGIEVDPKSLDTGITCL